MAKFRYLAADRSGKQKDVEIEAQDAAASLRRGLAPFSASLSIIYFAALISPFL